MGQFNNDFLVQHLNSIIHGDCMDYIKELPDNCVDLIFADPPYHKNKNASEIREYRAFTHKWMVACRRVLKPNGSAFIMSNKYSVHLMGFLGHKLGYGYLNDIVWSRPGFVSAEDPSRLTQRHETILWLTKNAECTHVLNKDVLKKLGSSTPKGCIPAGTVWTIPYANKEERVMGENDKPLHPTQRPFELIKNIVLLASKKGDLILDPFSGVGTACAVAKAFGRNFIGIEKESCYIRPASERVEFQKELEPFPAPAKKLPPRNQKFTPKPHNKPRVPYGSKNSRKTCR